MSRRAVRGPSGTDPRKRGSPSGGRSARLGAQRAPRAEPEAGSASGVALRCASLLRGGVRPARALELAVAAGGGDAELVGVVRRIAEGLPPPRALALASAPEWRVVAVAWRLAEQSGSPLAPALHRIGLALRALDRLRERRAVLLAGPRATVRLVSALPPLALLLGALLGFDPLPVLLSPLGAALLGSGSLLLAAGIAWSRQLRVRLERDDRVAGIELELAWVALGGGAPPGSALVRVVDAVDELGAEWVPFPAFERDGLLTRTIASATATGAPLRPLLLEEAGAARLRAQAELERAAERLGVRVLIPLGVCVLPAFIVLGVMPVVVAMLGG